MLLLDTNICIYIIKKKPLSVISELRSREISKIGISSIVLSELEYGVFKSQNSDKNRLALTKFITPFDVIAFDDMAAKKYGQVRSELERSGAPIGPLDTLIAAHALAIDATVVTNNVKEFSRVSGLKYENWT
jgi:tRNA(fMet)-specific endonuclease VapC